MLNDLLSGTVAAIWRLPDGSFCSLGSERSPIAGRDRIGLLPGSFNPLHEGHRKLRDVAERLAGVLVFFELSVTNVDKPPLDELEVLRRVKPFVAPVLLTNAPTFFRKIEVIQRYVTFVVGIDTAERIVAQRYYESASAMTAALDAFSSRGCRFLVAGRAAGQSFRTLAEATIPADYRHLFEPVEESDFRVDVSSTELRSHK